MRTKTDQKQIAEGLLNLRKHYSNQPGATPTWLLQTRPLIRMLNESKQTPWLRTLLEAVFLASQGNLKKANRILTQLASCPPARFQQLLATVLKQTQSPIKIINTPDPNSEEGLRALLLNNPSLSPLFITALADEEETQLEKQIEEQADLDRNETTTPSPRLEFFDESLQKDADKTYNADQAPPEKQLHEKHHVRKFIELLKFKELAPIVEAGAGVEVESRASSMLRPTPAA